MIPVEAYALQPGFREGTLAEIIRSGGRRELVLVTGVDSLGRIWAFRRVGRVRSRWARLWRSLWPFAR